MIFKKKAIWRAGEPGGPHSQRFLHGTTGETGEGVAGSRHRCCGGATGPTKERGPVSGEAEALGLTSRGGNKASGAFQAFPWPGPGPVAHAGDISWLVAEGCGGV